eukprot:1233254-Prymnesium_polylepis.1
METCTETKSLGETLFGETVRNVGEGSQGSQEITGGRAGSLDRPGSRTVPLKNIVQIRGSRALFRISPDWLRKPGIDLA